MGKAQVTVAGMKITAENGDETGTVTIERGKDRVVVRLTDRSVTAQYGSREPRSLSEKDP